MDIQFVLDVYAYAMYIVSYISTAQKGMNEWPTSFSFIHK